MASFPGEEDFDSWLAEVELANETLRKLQTGELSIEEFDRREKRRKLMEEQEKARILRKEQEKQEKLLKGRPGKGEKPTYQSFCRNCFHEYDIKLSNCTHCSAKTITYEDRKQDLQKKIQEYKEKKGKKQLRKHNWDMWQKTKAMTWKKTSTNYSKWDYFTSSESENEEKDTGPILPHNDPNFKALELDLQKRTAKRKADKQKADELKEKANSLLNTVETLKAKGENEIAISNLEKAINIYSEAIDLCRDYKALYNNRSLAYIKLKKYSKAIEDCEKVITYCEVFEKGFGTSKDACFKAFLRRALCYKEKNDLENSKKDIENALKLDPINKDAIVLQQEILAKISFQSSKSEIINKMQTKLEEYQQIIDSWLQTEPTEESTLKLAKIFGKNPETKIYFHEKNGLKKLFPLIPNMSSSFLVFDALLSQSSGADSDTFSTILNDEFCKMEGPQKLIGLSILFLEELNLEKMMNISEVLVTLTLNDRSRDTLKKDLRLAQLLNLIIQNFKLSEIKVFSNIFTVFGNICYQECALKKYIPSIWDQLLDSIKITAKKIHRSKVQFLVQNQLNFLANCLTDENCRLKSFNPPIILDIIKDMLEKINEKQIDLLESLLNLTVNLSFKLNSNSEILFKNSKIANIIQKYVHFSYLEPKYSNIWLRILTILSKITPDINFYDVNFLKDYLLTSKLFDEYSWKTGFANIVLRIMGKLFMEKEIQEYLRKNQLKPNKELLLALKICLYSQDEMRFCNSCVTVGGIVENFPEYQEFYSECVVKLLEIVREKLDYKRRNAAILLAKLAKNEKNLQILRDNHGIELLGSVCGMVAKK